jgi:DNA-binding transcriptional LysR family regulator
VPVSRPSSTAGNSGANDLSESIAFAQRMQKDPQRLPPLDLLASFEAAARHLSFTKAGAERFVTQSAMSRQIRALEDDLGVALFRRHHRALTLTDEGRRLQQTCAAALAQLRATVAALRAPSRREILALSTTPGLASLWLIPRLPSFTATHPGIDVRIDASAELRDLQADGFDLAIRYGRVGATPGTQLFAETTLPVCSPKLLRPGGAPLREPADLRLHTLLQFMAPPQSGLRFEWATWLQAVGLADLQPRSILTFNTEPEVIGAALAGQGVALGRLPLIDRLLRARKLVAPFKGALASPRAFYLILAPGARTKTAVRALEQWLTEQARAAA